MNPLDVYSWFILKEKEELIKQSKEIWMVKEAYKSETPKRSAFSKFLAVLGKELGCLGFSLEVRFGGQPETQTTLSQQSNLEGCA